MERVAESLRDWIFNVDEISTGVFRVKAVHKAGCIIELSGTNLDEIVEQARRDASELEHRLKARQ